MASAADSLHFRSKDVDIVAGSDNRGNNVNVHVTKSSPPVQKFLISFINYFVNRCLEEFFEKPIEDVRRTIQLIVSTKKGLFMIASDTAYYELFLEHMEDANPLSIDIGGVSTPLFNVDYLPDVTGEHGQPIEPIKNGIDLRVLKLFVACLYYHMGSFAGMGWIKEPIGNGGDVALVKGATILDNFSTILPAIGTDARAASPAIPATLVTPEIPAVRARAAVIRKVPQDVQDACIKQHGNTIQKIYFTNGLLFFMGEFNSNPGVILTFKVNVSTQNPPIPSGHIVWNNVNPLLSTQLFFSEYDKDGINVSIILETTAVIIIRDPRSSEFQNWQVDKVHSHDGYVEFNVTCTDGKWMPQIMKSHDDTILNQDCTVYLMNARQTVPTYRDILASEIKKFTSAHMGGRKKRQNKSKRKKQKKSNKKLGFSKRRYSRRRRRMY